MIRGERKLLERLFELVLEERRTAPDREQVVRFRKPDELRQALDPEIPETGLSEDELVDAIHRYLEWSVDTGHPHFLNQLWSGFNPSAFAGEVIAALRNTSMYTYEVAPAATLLEEELVGKMGSLIGYPDPDGTFVTGGSNANLLAMLLARHAVAPEVKERGYADTPRLTAFVSDQAHFSFEQAAHVLGIGTSGIVMVETDGGGRMIPERLRAVITASRDQGERPFFIGATGGTTVLGAFDPIDPIADIAEENGIWLHVDGSWGGSVLLSRRWRTLLDGAHRSNSFGWTAHKMMGVPLICSALLLRERDVLRQTISLTESPVDYLFHDLGESRNDLGQKSLQCGRRADVVKLWLSWLSHGDRGYEERIDRVFEVVKYAAERIEEAEDFELAAPVQSMNVCFRYLPPNGAHGDGLEADVRELLKAQGRFMINYSSVNDRNAFRLVVPSPDITPDDIDELLQGIRDAAATLQSEPIS